MIRFMRIQTTTLLLAASCFLQFLSGCTSENPEPEKMDPMFAEFEKRIEAYKKDVEEQTAKIKGFREALAKAEPNSIERKDILRDLEKARRKLLDSEQWLKFYTIRMKRKLVVDRVEYKRALAEGNQWPVKSEYSDYQLNRRLVESSRNWATRVPKLQDRVPGSSGAPKKREAEKKPAH
jgi:hypothetical protein